MSPFSIKSLPTKVCCSLQQSRNFKFCFLTTSVTKDPCPALFLFTPNQVISRKQVCRSLRTERGHSCSKTVEVSLQQQQQRCSSMSLLRKHQLLFWINKPTQLQLLSVSAGFTQGSIKTWKIEKAGEEKFSWETEFSKIASKVLRKIRLISSW